MRLSAAQGGSGRGAQASTSLRGAQPSSCTTRAGLAHPTLPGSSRSSMAKGGKEGAVSGPTGFSPSHCSPLLSQGHSDPQEDTLLGTGCCPTSL